MRSDGDWVAVRQRAVGAALLLGGSASFVGYTALFVNTLLEKDAAALEASLQSGGAVYWLVGVPTLVPATVVFAYVVWIGLKVYIHSPPESSP